MTQTAWRKGGSVFWYQGIVSIFAHADIWHLSANMTILRTVGPEVLYALGCSPSYFFTLYIAAGFAGHIMTKLSYNTVPPSLEASGAIYGLIGCIIVLKPNESVGIIGDQYRASPVTFIVMMMVNDFIRNVSTVRTINIAAHFGGFCAGWLFSFLYKLAK